MRNEKTAVEGFGHPPEAPLPAWVAEASQPPPQMPRSRFWLLWVLQWWVGALTGLLAGYALWG